MNCRLSLVSAELDAGDLQALTRDFCNTANGEEGLLVELVHGAADPGSKAVDVPLIGHLVLTFLSSMAAESLVNACRLLFFRDSTIDVRVERGDGAKLTIKEQNLHSDQIARTLEVVREFARGA